MLQWLAERGLVAYRHFDGVFGLVMKATENERLEVVCWLIQRTLQSNADVEHRRLATGVPTIPIHTTVVYGSLDVASYLHKLATVSVNGQKFVILTDFNFQRLLLMPCSDSKQSILTN